MVDASIFGIFISKLYYEKKPCPVILFKVDKDLKVNFYYIILLFSLAIYLWIKSGEESLLDAKEIV